MEDYAIALGGGGARGGYEIGVWKALKELGIPIAAVAGTSVGALNGAVMVQDDFDRAYELWTSMTAERIINLENDIFIKAGKKKNRVEKFKLVKQVISSKGLDQSPLKQLISEIIDENRVRNSQMDFGIVTFRLSGLKPVKLFKEDIPTGKLVDYLIASSCFPAFKPYEIDNNKYIDGGFADNIPISMLVEKNYKNIISVDVSGPGRVKKVDTSSVNIIYIKNSDDLGGILEFDGERSKFNIELGYYDTLKTFSVLYGKKYCLLAPNKSEEVICSSYPEKLERKDLINFYLYLGLNLDDKMSARDKFITHRVIKAIKLYSDKPLNADNTLTAMAEICAELVGIERFRRYTYYELVDKIISEYKASVSDKDFAVYSKLIHRFIRRDSSITFDIDGNTPLINRKYLVFFMPQLTVNDQKVIKYRKLLSAALPKVSAANLFLSFILSAPSY